MSYETIQTDEAPDAIGPYSQAVRSGNVVYLSGQIPLVPATMQMVEGGFEAQLYGADSNRGATVIENTPEGRIEGMKVVEPSAPVEQESFQEFFAFNEERGTDFLHRVGHGAPIP